MLNFSFTRSSLHIQDSCEVAAAADMRTVLKDIRMQVPAEQCLVLNRSNRNLIAEWKTHNLLHSMGLFKSRTESVDFEYPQTWYYKLAYGIISLGYIFVK